MSIINIASNIPCDRLGLCILPYTNNKPLLEQWKSHCFELVDSSQSGNARRIAVLAIFARSAVCMNAYIGEPIRQGWI